MIEWYSAMSWTFVGEYIVFLRSLFWGGRISFESTDEEDPNPQAWMHIKSGISLYFRD